MQQPQIRLGSETAILIGGDEGTHSGFADLPSEAQSPNILFENQKLPRKKLVTGQESHFSGTMSNVDKDYTNIPSDMSST